MTGISVTKEIYSILLKNGELTKKVEGRIYPVIAEEGSNFPFVIIKRNSITPEYYKIGNANDIVQFSVTVVANNYIDSVEIAEIIRNSLEYKKTTLVKSIRIKEVTEDYQENSYVQELQFEAILSIQ